MSEKSIAKALAKKPDLSGILADSARDVELKKYVEMSEEEMLAAGLTDVEIRKVRAWSRPRAEIPFWLQASHDHVAASLGKEAERTNLTLNVESMTVIQIPDKEDDTGKRIYIDVDPTGGDEK